MCHYSKDLLRYDLIVCICRIFVTCIFIYISVTFIVFPATMFMVNKDCQYQNTTV